jgi:hypothetical protein
VLLETLEPRLLLATVTAEEQLFVYLLNRARHDPAAYAQEVGLGNLLDGIAAQPPLAVNNNLFDSTDFHAKDMADSNYFAHQNPVTLEWPNRMARDAGYVLPPSFADTQNNIESIAGGTTTAESTLALLLEDAGVPGAGHRVHLLATVGFFQLHREIGVGHAYNVNSMYQDYWAIHTAYRTGANPFLTGVVFNDLDLDGRYDLNEGLAGITITVGGAKYYTNAQGGYSIPATAGSRTLTVQGAGFTGTATATVDVTDQNVEVDFLSGHATGIVNFGPAAPGPVAASDGAFTDKVRVTWDPVANASSYEVWRNTTNDPSTAVLKSTPISAFYNDTDAVAGTLYYYWIKAKSATGTSVFSLSDAGRRNAIPTVAALTPLPDTFFRGASLQLTATGVADIDGTISRVQFYRDVNGNGTYEATDTALGYGTLAAGVWSWTGSTAKFPYGSVRLLARAQDNNGAWSDPLAATVTVENPDPEPPAVSLVSGDIVASPGARCLLQVSYTDNMGVDASDIGARDIRVKGPNKFNALATFVSATSKTDVATITATYSLAALGGAWDFADNGLYQVFMEPSQVSDWNDNWVVTANPGNVIGTFNVDLPNDGDQTPTFGTISLLAPLVPGDKANVSVIVRNIGGAKATGTSVDQLWLSPKPDDLTGAFLLGTKTSKVNLGPGATRTVTYSVVVPGQAAAGTWYLVADINTTASSTDLHADNNRVATAGRDLVWQFGNVGTRKNVLVTLPDGDGTLVTFGLRGPGTGTVVLNAGSLDMALAGTTTASAVTVTAKKPAAPGDDGKAAIGNVAIGDTGNPADQTSLGSFTARASNLTGNFTVMGSLATLTLDDVAGDRLVDVRNTGNATSALALAFDRVSDLSVTAAMPLRSVTATEWLETGTHSITAPSVGTLTIRGDAVRKIPGNFEIDLNLTSALAAQSLTRMTVKAWMRGSMISARSGIGSVTVGGLQDSAIFAGVANVLMQLPDPGKDFDLVETIRSVTVRGIAGAAASMINSHIAAAHLGTMSLGVIQFDNLGTPFGLAADKLTRLTYKNGKTSYAWPNTKPTEKAGPLPVQDFEVWLV